MDRQAKPYSLPAMISFISDNFALFFIVGLFFLGGFFSGSLWTQNQTLRNGTGTAVAGTGTGTGTADAPTAPTGPTPEQLKSIPKVADTDYTRGGKNAKVVLYEYTDFECPFCERFHPTMKQISQEYGDKILWVARHYPLSFHPNAQKAAEASECVGKLRGNDAFWIYADRIFEEQAKLGNKLSPEAINTAAQAAGVDMAQFKTCLDSGEMAQKVKDSMDKATAAGVSGTPNTIVLTEDGQAELIPGALDAAAVKAIVDKYL